MQEKECICLSLWTLIPPKFNARTVSNATRVVPLSLHMSECAARAKLKCLASSLKFGLGLSQRRQWKKQPKHAICTLDQEAEKDLVYYVFPQRTSGEKFYRWFAFPYWHNRTTAKQYLALCVSGYLHILQMFQMLFIIWENILKAHSHF